jgi:hypothetical protein
MFCRRLSRQDVEEIINRQFDVPAAAAQAIDHFMASDCAHPWRDRLILVPSLPLQMDGQQNLLYDIFDIGIPESGTRKAAAHYLSQERR